MNLQVLLLPPLVDHIGVSLNNSARVPDIPHTSDFVEAGVLHSIISGAWKIRVPGCIPCAW